MYASGGRGASHVLLDGPPGVTLLTAGSKGGNMPDGTGHTKHETWREQTYTKKFLDEENKVLDWLKELRDAIDALPPDEKYEERYELKIILEAYENLDEVRALQQCSNRGSSSKTKASGKK
jgi:hypothetical protein